MNSPYLYSFLDIQQEFNLDSHAIDKMQILLQQLMETNRITNLTAITDFQEALIKHFYDSLLILRWSQFEQIDSIIDIGSGAGFPALPLAICQPRKSFVLLEATLKKVNFQSDVSQIMGLHNTISVWARAEEYAHRKDQRQKYDLVLARAVSSAASLAELTIPYARLDGYIVFYKGQDYQKELKEAESAIKLLGCQLIETFQYQLPLDYGVRNLIVLQKINDTPTKYPRNSGIPQKRPL